MKFDVEKEVVGGELTEEGPVEEPTNEKGVLRRNRPTRRVLL